MKFYLAGNYKRHDELFGIARILHLCGHVVTSRWLLGSHDASYVTVGQENGSSQAFEEIQKFGLEDYQDVLAADVLVHFAKPEGYAGRDRGGRHVEFGIGLGKPNTVAVQVGNGENIFHALRRVIRYPSPSDFLRGISNGHFPASPGFENGHCGYQTEDCIRNFWSQKEAESPEGSAPEPCPCSASYLISSLGSHHPLCGRGSK